jgi:cell surface protein SprA
MNKNHLLSFLLFFSVTTFLSANTKTDTVPLRDRTGDYLRDSVVNSFNLRDPDVIQKDVEYDPTANKYYITEKIGDYYYRTPTVLTFDEYVKWKSKEQERQYFERLAGLSKKRGGEPIDPLSRIDFTNTQNSKLKMLLKSAGINGKLPEVPKLDIKRLGDNFIGMIFGDPPTVDIRPQGQIDLTLGGDYRYTGNPVLPTFARTNGGLLFNMDIQMNVTGKIGEKLNLNTSFNNKATFDFDNIMKLNYNSDVFGEDDIIKSIEGGNVSLPLRGSLIQGSQNLFGLKTELQFGHLRITALAAQQRNRRNSVQVQGGAQFQQFNVPIDLYDENKHFFLTHFNRNTFESALKTLPLINSQFSITKLEVWVSNERNEDKEVRQVVALTDLGEGERITNRINRVNPGRPTALFSGDKLPDNNVNDLYDRLRNDSVNTRRIDKVINALEGPRYDLSQGRDFMKRAMKRLQPSEYTFNPKLGTLSINNVERQQVVGVAFTYFYNGQGPFQVGEFAENVANVTGADSISQVIFIKLLKSTIQLPQTPLFDLMMKNVYSVGAYVTNPQDLQLDIVYQDPGENGAKGNDKAEKRNIREIPEQPLLRLLNLDKLNQVGDPQPDGQFDFVPDVTINTRTGRIMFPVLEPFGRSLKAKLDSITKDPSVSAKYTYQALYDSTLFRAQELQSRNRFIIRGRVKSSASNRIQLNAFGLKPGAVTVSAGAYQLLEGVDYSIDYGSSTLTVLNLAYVAPNIPLNISYEDNALFGLQTRTMLGLRADYEVKKNFNIGATYMNLFEQPFTRKVNYGDDPIDNTVYGLDINMSQDAPWLTKLVDKIPLIDTKEPSKITFSAEGALLKPGHASAIEVGDDKGGVVYMDDFEGSSSPFSVMSQPNTWALASTPQKHPLWKEGSDSIYPGVNRAMLNWYRPDQSIFPRSGASAGDIYVSTVSPTEVFPNRNNGNQGGFANGQGFNLTTFDLTYYPRLRGPYNFDIPNGGYVGRSKGLDGSGGLREPQTRWAGIMRGLTTTDFEAANFEYIDTWILDPLQRSDRHNNEGSLIIHLGDVSEDILRDSRKMYENGLPSPSNPELKSDKTRWGRVPRTEVPLPNSFAANDNDRLAQDVGLDGLNDEGERNAYVDYLDKIKTLNADAVKKITADPSNDDFTYYDDKNFAEGTDFLKRYERFNGPEGNSANTGTSVQSATNIPDAEDVNRDNSFEENEAYYEYRIDFKPSPFGIKEGIDTRDLKYYVETLKDDKPNPNSTVPPTGRIWHHFRIPIDAWSGKYGQINDFRSIRFMRMIMKGFEDTSTVRFAKLDLVRNQWRRYKPITYAGGFIIPTTDSTSNFMELNSVNVEENSRKLPFNYVLPPGILRENIQGSFAAGAQQNEQALSMRFKKISKGRRLAAFKLFSMDMRVYERLKMFVHAENTEGGDLKGKICSYMRIGSDFENNYYEYELPLTMSDDKIAAPTNSPLPPDSYREEVWRKENTFDFPLSLLTKAKLARNAANIPLTTAWGFEDPDKPGNFIRIKGNPDIGLVKGVMFGVYNKDDAEHDFEVWINELRVTGLNESAGGAALARADFKLADFGNLSVSGNYLGIGYGAIDQRVQQRSREQVVEWGITGNFELGKFLPQKSGIKVPFTVQYNNNTRTPEFDPYDLDLKLSDKLANTPSAERRDTIKDAAQTVQTIKGFSFNNVRKERTSSEKKPMPWDIENFSASYGYTELERKDPLVESDARQNYKGSVDYNYSREPLYIQPFKNTIKNDTIGRYLKFFTEFHFNPIPNTFGFNTIMDRQLNVTRYRFSGEDPQFNTYYQRRFGWDRNYNMQWDFTRSLKLNYDAKTFAIIDELFDYRDGSPVADGEKKDYLWKNIKSFGRTKRYDQNVNLNYTLPTRNIPFMDWVNVRATYGGTYGWEAFAYNPQIDDEPEYRFQQIGNFINNKQSRQVSVDLNFDNLYNYSKYLKKIQAQMVKKPKAKKGEAPSVINPNLPKIAENKTDTAAVIGKKKKKKDEEHEPTMIERILVRPLLTLRKARLTYNEQLGSYVPGFKPQARLFGMQDLSAPGWDYALGFQQADDNWLEKARVQNWISSDYRQTRPLLNNYQQSIDARISLEPFTDFRVDLDLTKNYTKNRSQEFRNTSTTLSNDSIRSYNKFDDGSYTISYFTLNTLNKDIEEVYNQFIRNSSEVSNILGANEPVHPEFREYKNGYGPTNQDVLVPAFIAAYTGRDIKTSNRDLFKETPNINWRLTYNGLAKLDMFKKTFSNISITHGYKSTMTVSSFRTEPFYNELNPRTPRNESKFEYYTQYNIPTLVIAEAFSPLLGIDVSLKSGANFGFQYRKSRNLALSVSDTRLQETRTSEISFKFGHRLKNIYIKFLDFDIDKKKKEKEAKEKKEKEKQDKLAAGDVPDPKAKKKREPKAKKGNDLVLSFDVSLRDDISENRYITQDQKQPSRGAQTIRVAPSATYTVNKRLDLRFYVDYNKIVPYTTASFPTVTAAGGFVITFKLN